MKDFSDHYQRYTIVHICKKCGWRDLSYCPDWAEIYERDEEKEKGALNEYKHGIN